MRFGIVSAVAAAEMTGLYSISQVSDLLQLRKQAFPQLRQLAFGIGRDVVRHIPAMVESVSVDFSCWNLIERVGIVGRRLSNGRRIVVVLTGAAVDCLRVKLLLLLLRVRVRVRVQVR